MICQNFPLSVWHCLEYILLSKIESYKCIPVQNLGPYGPPWRRTGWAERGKESRGKAQRTRGLQRQRRVCLRTCQPARRLVRERWCNPHTLTWWYHAACAGPSKTLPVETVTIISLILFECKRVQVPKKITIDESCWK